MSFLPPGYESPKGNSHYTKLEEGETKLRILSAPIIGWEDWIDKKPKRYRYEDKPKQPHDPDKPLKHFFTFIVWNYRTNKLEIYQCTQGSVRKRLESLSTDKDWGSPFNYDIKISKTGKMMQTQYELNPCPARELAPEIKDAFMAMPIDLEELFKGGDPFVASPEYRTKGFWEMEQEEPKGVEYITKKEAQGIDVFIEEHISAYDASWRGNCLNALKIPSFEKLERRLYASLKKKMDEKKNQLFATFIPNDEVPF